jgi:hypothetical protein
MDSTYNSDNPGASTHRSLRLESSSVARTDIYDMRVLDVLNLQPPRKRVTKWRPRRRRLLK